MPDCTIILVLHNKKGCKRFDFALKNDIPHFIQDDDVRWA